MAQRKPQQQVFHSTSHALGEDLTILALGDGASCSERSSSPFWRSRPSPTPRQAVTKSTKVIGASYSHADMLKFDSLTFTNSGSRPRTPPVSSNKSAAATPPPDTRYMSPDRRPYSTFSKPTYGNWDVGVPSNEGEEDEDELIYDDDEDEFGLPSISSMRRKRSMKNKAYSSHLQAGTGLEQVRSAPSLAPSALPANFRSNSFDIAEERNPLSYPSARKGEGKILRPQYKDILRDPANSLHLINHPVLDSRADTKETHAHQSRISRINKFKRILQASTVSSTELRAAAWFGVPEEVRAMTWQILLGYLPVNSERRVATLERKRKEYLDSVRQAFENGSSGNKNGTNPGLAGLASNPPVTSGRGRGLDEVVWHQISIDVPRTNPHLKLYQFEATQRSLERILYVWAIRHPASGYVQGINDLATPFWQVFLGTYITDLNIESGMDPGQLPKAVLDAVEADTYWCLTKLLDGIQDNYIVAQPGIHRQVSALRDLVTRIDGTLAKHFEKENVEYMQFSFRWMNCLLMREISVKNTIRMWDTYLSEENGFSQFHLYVCAAFLVRWTDKLIKMNFQEILMFLQALPTKEWTEKDIEMLLSEAFIWQSLFRNSQAHLRSSSSTSNTFGSLGPPG